MAIKGSLREASLADVLQLLALGQKTGCLSVTDRSNFGYIYFDAGNISYAAIVNRRDRLGDLLVKNGVVAPEVLAAAVDAQGSRTAQRLGEILIERGALSRSQLERYIRVQIEEAVYFLFTWTQGSFYFEADQRPEEGAMLVSIHPESLLLEGARRVDEWALIEKKIPSIDLIFGIEDPNEELPQADLTPEQRKILPLLDGKRSLRDIIEDSGLVEFDAGKALFGLVQAGFAHALRRKEPRAAPSASPGRVQEHRNLGIAFYRTGMFDEAVREFRRVLELQPENLEARFHLGVVALRAGNHRAAIRHFQELIDAGGRWGASFQNLSLALERLGRFDDALAVLEEAGRHIAPDPRVLLSRAILLLKSGRPRDAASAFEAYRSRIGSAPPPVAYYALAPLAEAAAGRSEVAIRLGAEGVERYPEAAVLLLHLGALHDRAGRAEAAEALYRQAVEQDPRLPQGFKSLADALYRKGAYEQAGELYKRCVGLAPDLGDDAYFKLGNIEYKRNARDRAVELWRRAVTLNPQNRIARTNLELVETAIASRR